MIITEPTIETATTKSERSRESDKYIYNNLNTAKTNRRNYRRLWGYALATFLFLVVVAVILVVDLIGASVKEVKVEGITVDVRSRQPVVEIELLFEYGSRFSSVEPRGMKCQLESGDVDFQVSKEEDEAHNYLVKATSPIEDVVSHADVLWEILTKKDGISLTDLVESGTCEMDIQVRLGYVLPFHHSVEMPLEKFLEMDPEENDQNKNNDNGDDDDDDRDDNYEQDKNKEIHDEVVQPFFANVCHVDKQTLDVCIPLRLPESSISMLPSVLRFKTPALQLNAKPDSTTGMMLSMDEWEATFNPNQEEDVVNSKMAVLSLSSQNDNLPFYRPVIDLFLTDANSTTIFVDLDGEESFMEILLGRHHEFTVQHYRQDSGDFQNSYNSKQLRNLKPFTTEDYLEEYNDAAAKCIGVGDDSNAFGFGFCWLLDFLEERLSLTGNMTISDWSMLAFSDLSWAIDDESLQIDMGGSVFVLEEEDLMNLLGQATIDFADDDTIQVDLSVENNGALWPFAAKIETTSSAEEEVQFKIDIDTLTFLVDGNGIDVASGEMSMNWDEDFVQTFEMNFRLDHGDTDFVSAQLELSNDSIFSLSGSSVSDWDNEKIWDASMEFQIILDSSDNESGSMNTFVKDTVSDREVSFVGSVDTTEMGIIMDGKLLNNQEDLLAIQFEFDRTSTLDAKIIHDGNDSVAVLLQWADGVEFEGFETDGILVTGNLVCFWDEEYCWDMDLTFTNYGWDEDSNSNKIALQIIEAVSEFTMDGDCSVFHGEIDGTVMRGSTEVTLDETKQWDADFDIVWTSDWENEYFTDKIVATINESVLDLNMNGDIVLFFNDDEEMYVLSASSDGTMEEEERWDMDSNLTLSYDWDDSFYSQSIAIEVNEALRDFNMFSDVKTTRNYDEPIVDFDYWLTIFSDEDSGNTNSIDEIDARRNSEGGPSDGVEVEIFIQQEKDIYLDGTATVATDIDSASLTLDLDMPMATRHLDTTLGCEFNNDMVIQSQVHYWWEDENYIDLTSKMMLGLEEGLLLELSSIDQGNIDFAANFTTQIHGDDTSMGASIERLLFKSKADTFVDLFMSMGLEELNSGDIKMEMLSKSNEEADLQMNMDVSMAWIQENESLRVSADHMILGWRETMFLELPMLPPEIYGSSVPSTSPTSAPSHSPTHIIPDPEESEVFSYPGVSIRLEGMPALTNSTRIAFEEGTEAFYDEIYQTSTSRRLEGDLAFSFFKTDVIVIDDKPDLDGNTIIYDQTITVVTTATNTNVGATEARDSLLSPLMVDSDKEEYLKSLVKRNEEFSKVSEVSTPDVPVPNDVEKVDGLSAGAIAGIILALLSVCGICCGVGIYFWCKQQHNGVYGVKTGLTKNFIDTDSNEKSDNNIENSDSDCHLFLDTSTDFDEKLENGIHGSNTDDGDEISDFDEESESSIDASHKDGRDNCQSSFKDEINDSDEESESHDDGRDNYQSSFKDEISDFDEESESSIDASHNDGRDNCQSSFKDEINDSDEESESHDDGRDHYQSSLKNEINDSNEESESHNGELLDSKSFNATKDKSIDSDCKEKTEDDNICNHNDDGDDHISVCSTMINPVKEGSVISTILYPDRDDSIISTNIDPIKTLQEAKQFLDDLEDFVEQDVV